MLEIVVAVISAIILIAIMMGINSISENSRKSLKILNEIAKHQGVDTERILEINDPDHAYKNRLKQKQLDKQGNN